MMSTPKHLERAGASTQASRRRVLLAASTLFALSAAATLRRSAAMQTQGTPMPGGWLLSMHWTPLCGQTWLAAAASFVGMWMTMMAAMMLPVIVPMLLRLPASPRNTASACAGYFAVWLGVGVLLFAALAPAAAFALHSPAVARAAPFASGFVVIAASALQFARAKARRLACCAAITLRAPAFCAGLRFGARCAACCGNLMAALVAIGMMNPAAMAAVSAAIALERFAPGRVLAARIVGAAGVAVGSAMLLRALASA